MIYICYFCVFSYTRKASLVRANTSHMQLQNFSREGLAYLFLVVSCTLAFSICPITSHEYLRMQNMFRPSALLITYMTTDVRGWVILIHLKFSFREDNGLWCGDRNQLNIFHNT
jgi:hypothetical protein